MIPELIRVAKSPWPLLPPGIHVTDLATVEQRFASSIWRRKLFNGLLEACGLLSRAGCQRLYLNGSFITEKPIPNDYDACWDPNGVNYQLMDPLFFDFSNNRAAQKAKFGGEFFPATSTVAGVNITFLDFFQFDTNSRKQKGIVGVDLANDPMLNHLRPS